MRAAGARQGCRVRRRQEMECRGRWLLLGHAGLYFLDDRPEKPGREETWTERTCPILANLRQLLKSGSDRSGHMLKPPADLLPHGIWLVSSGEARRFGGIRSRAKSVRSDVRNGCGLPCCSCRGDGRERPHVTSGTTTPEPTPDLVGNLQLTTRESPRASDCVTRTAVLWSLRLKQPEHGLGAVRRPHRNDPTVSQAQRLRRSHPPNMSPNPAPDSPCRARQGGRSNDRKRVMPAGRGPASADASC